jgi:hypothetical protein
MFIEFNLTDEDYNEYVAILNAITGKRKRNKKSTFKLKIIKSLNVLFSQNYFKRNEENKKLLSYIISKIKKKEYKSDMNDGYIETLRMCVEKAEELGCDNPYRMHKNKVKLIIKRFSKKKYDYINFVGGCKAIEDVLRYCGLIYEDSEAYIAHELTQEKNADNEHYIIRIEIETI